MAKTPAVHPDPQWNSAGAVDSGTFEDKTGGIDPAAAPMETDAEAGGFAQPGASGGPPASDQVRNTKRNEASYGNAMRRGARMPSVVQRIRWLPLLGIGLAAVAVLLWVASRG
jgi:hypothetical protein